MAQLLISDKNEADRCRRALMSRDNVRVRGESPDGLRRTLIGQVMAVQPLEGDQPRWLITIEQCAPAQQTLH